MLAKTQIQDEADYGTNLMTETSVGQNRIDWGLLVDQVRNGDPAGMEQLYLVFERGVRFYLFRRLGQQELEDKVHDVFLIVVEAIRRGELREPERLMGFIRTIVRRQVASHIGDVVQTRREEMSLDSAPVLDRNSNPEEDAMGNEQNRIMLRILNSMSARDREILTRFYLREESQEKICAEMQLTETQFRLLKSRAKQRFGDLGRRRLEGRVPGQRSRNIFVRVFDRVRH